MSGAVGLEKLDVDLCVVLGRTRMPLHLFLKLGRGAVVALDPTDGELVDVLANGHPIARGSVAVTEGRVTVEVTELIRKEQVDRSPDARVGSTLLPGRFDAAPALERAA